MPEMIDVLDENGVKTGHIATRDEVHREGLWHRCIVVAILNDKNEILLQQRAHNKEKNPDMWDISVAGHISAGQDSLSAAAREINEEVSVNLGRYIDISEFRYMFCFRREQNYGENYIDRQFFDFFILRQPDLRIENIKMQESEVQDIKFCTISELRELIEKHKLVERPAEYAALEDYIFKI